MNWKGGKFGLVCLVFQVIFIALFGIFVEYDPSASASDERNQKDRENGGQDVDHNEVAKYYPMFQDVHVMIFIGFGFLMTFLRRYGFSAVGLNMVVAAFVLQWHMLFSGFLHMHDGHIVVNIHSLLTADFAAAAVLITYGALLGKTSPLQMIVIAFIEIIIFTANEHIGLKYLQVVDVGGSMFVHAFGAYFGLALSRVLHRDDIEESEKEGSNYHSDIFAMIGTVFLWLYWPSFNSALAPGDDQHRAVINTYLALAACCLVAFAVSALVSHGNKFDMVHVQNATLAGGVAVGTSADMMIHPYGALCIGSVAGTLSVVGYRYITPFMASKLKIHDTCGVNNLHGMPGVLAGIIGAIVSAVATTETYGHSLYQIFPARAPLNGTDELAAVQGMLGGVEAGDGWTAGKQAGMQVCALVMTLAVAVVGGALTGLVMKLPFFDQPKGRDLFDDTPFWETPEDFTAGYRKLEASDGKLLKQSGEDKVMLQYVYHC